MSRALSSRMLGALAPLLLLAVLAAGCGSQATYANADRPPAPISISIAVSGDRIGVSPDRVGAGPVTLLIANESARSQDVRLTAAGGGGRSCVTADASSGPINRQGAARMSIGLVQGTCKVSVADAGVAPGRLAVGPERRSAQQDLLAP